MSQNIRVYIRRDKDGNHRLVKTYREGKRRIGAVIFDVETLKPFLVEDIPAVVSASMLKALGR